MRLNRLDRIEFFTMSCGISGLIGIAIGTTAITGSLIALKTNPFNVVPTHGTLIKKVTRFGLTSLGGGLFAFGLGIAVAKHVGENLPSSFTQGDENYLTKTHKCQGCKYFHGYYSSNENYLICAVHPAGVEESICPDWEPKA